MLLHSRPAPAQRGHEHWLDDQEDVFPAGVLGAKLRTLLGVEAAGKEGAEDAGLDGGPVVARHPVQNRHTVRVQFEHDVVIEEAAVEV